MEDVNYVDNTIDGLEEYKGRIYICKVDMNNMKQNYIEGMC